MRYWWRYTRAALDRKREDFWIWLAWKLPLRLVYWCAVRVGAYASTGCWATQDRCELTLMEAIRRWTAPDQS